VDQAVLRLDDVPFGLCYKIRAGRILAVDILRTGFEWALEHSCLTHFDASLHDSQEAWEARLEVAPVRIQWDPERTARLEALPWRTIQVGLRGAAVRAYLDEWIVRIDDVTMLVGEVRDALKDADMSRVQSALPIEVPYPLPN
jgi:hypothetical protein